jgi:hypothetical protein
MSKIFYNRRRTLIFVILIMILGTAAYGFAASIDMSGLDVNAGEGSTVISGYTVTSLDFTLNPANPTVFSDLDFNLDGGADTVYVGLDLGGASLTWITCTTAPDGGGGTDVNCVSIAGESVYDLVGLTISAVQ